MADTVHYTIDDLGIATVTLNRPDRLNSMTGELLDDALDLLSDVADNSNVRVLILTGSGRGFCAGGDLTLGPGGAVTGDATGEEASRRLRQYMETSQLLHTMPAVTIAAINGACAGAGLSWACATDLRYASSTARFNVAFRNAALSGDFGGTWTLPRIIGAGRAREKYLLSEPFDAAEAARIGLVTDVLPPDELIPHVRKVAVALATASPHSLQLIKKNLTDSEYTTFAAQLDIEAKRHSHCAETADAKEAAQAFTEKRAPNFTGS
ncbi:enoyl-CoA hydratase [Rhodococcus wratislaviensis]|uniref:Putative enoyl-CoA hydratase n=1 Tax=Rhodococcus wratislaviensis NBRC 100605 TaxID=1219028 RepID=X0PTV2_RHOWR|nr:enoyl-CoA hydratase [Rhodococcus wratislaviensis]GAF46544.1 putative enoyl-CoA hydratase [Rhodococcus wratislaviensis NBRC 100605]